MTYTVKNGTWCKDNEKEYYSTTETGLKAALKAGEITAGTKVVIHEPRQPAGTIIQSLNPNPPEGFMVPDGSAIDPVYAELRAIVGANLPDLREYVLVCAGQNAATMTHDVFTAGEAKQDTAAIPAHSHTLTDPGHSHTVTDAGHSHTLTDPGHSHTVTDAGHDHGRGTQNITGTFGSDDALSGHITGAFYTQSNIPYDAQSTAYGDGYVIALDASRTWTGRSENVTTGVTVNSGTTGVTVNSGTTGITIAEAPAVGTVTRTKEYGVYYYIAF